MKKTLYILSCFFNLILFANHEINAQKLNIDALGFGVDISKYVINAVNTNILEHEIFLNIGLPEKTDIIAEYGYSDSQIEKYNYYYNVKGIYQKYGVNYHVIKEKRDNIFIGSRFGYCKFNRNITDALIQDEFWGSNMVDFTNETIRSYWLEFVAGIKVEVLTNFFLSWDFRIKTHLSSTKDDLMKVIYIPGYGKRNSKLGSGFSYTISYQIPF